MSTVDRTPPRVQPPLVEGERLDQPTFHARYEAMPPNTRAELIGGIVYMTPFALMDHGESDADVNGWLVRYKQFTPGVRGGGDVSTILGGDSEVQPDGVLIIPAEAGGRTQIKGGYLYGPPELVVEVSQASRRIDLGEKKRDYERFGVPEYLVIDLVAPRCVHWFELREARFVDLPIDPDGLYRSHVFPGLWLDPAAFLAGDLNQLMTALERGIASAEHADFVARLKASKHDA
jgi:Uma2 family endonuclease